jgi:hypothetical protein
MKTTAPSTHMICINALVVKIAPKSFTCSFSLDRRLVASRPLHFFGLVLPR